MKIIVVSGARSGVGKTQLSRALCELLPGGVHIKIGHHARKPAEGRSSYLYQMGTSFGTVAAEHSDAHFLVIESNQILEEMTPECTIYLPAENPKPSAEIAFKKADVIRGESVQASKIAVLAKRLGCEETVVRKIIELAGALEG
jgi:dethiobiotin synthetase